MGRTPRSCASLRSSRHEEAQRLRQSPSLPSILLAHDLEAASAGDPSDNAGASDAIRGTRVAGSKVVEGRARVITEEDAELGNPMEDFRDGDIIVAAMINPAWLPYFARAGGFVSEVGGWLSHPAILAREYDVAMIVGTEGIGRIADGCRLRLNLDGKIEVVTEEVMAVTSRPRSGLRARQATRRRLRAALVISGRFPATCRSAATHRHSASVGKLSQVDLLARTAAGRRSGVPLQAPPSASSPTPGWLRCWAN